MKYGVESAKMIDFDRVFLDQDNPRHEPFDDQAAVIGYLCHDEQVLPLAKDIAKNGLNPLELFALIPDGDDAYIAAEGNRRLGALKLLNDPDLAPSNQRQEFKQASSTWTPIQQLFAIVFDSRNDVRLWLDRMHAGFASGRGRRQWNAEQKARNSGYSKNDLAQTILDNGEDRNFISATERRGRLSTVQRYLSNPHMRNALGLDVSDLDNVTTELPDEDFHIVFKRFMEDVAMKRITTRDNSSRIIRYANGLCNLQGVSGERAARHPIAGNKTSTQSRPKPAAQRPKKPAKISHSEKLRNALGDIQSYKLEKLYYSLCNIRLEAHTPLLSVGAWSFIETFTAIAGRTASTDFYSYLSNQKLSILGLGSKQETRSIREALKRVSEFGNSTKHHRSSAAFNGEQLANDFETMEKLLLALAVECKGKS